MLGTKNHTCGAGVHECLNPRLLCSLDQVLRSLHIDLVVDLVLRVEMGRCRVDDGIRLNLREDGLDSGEIGDVSVVVRDVGAGASVCACAEVDHGDLGLGMPLHKEIDDVTA